MIARRNHARETATMFLVLAALIAAFLVTARTF